VKNYLICLCVPRFALKRHRNFLASPWRTHETWAARLACPRRATYHRPTSFAAIRAAAICAPFLASLPLPMSLALRRTLWSIKSHHSPGRLMFSRTLTSQSYLRHGYEPFEPFAVIGLGLAVVGVIVVVYLIITNRRGLASCGRCRAALSGVC
jgi:hypothetical protein